MKFLDVGDGLFYATNGKLYFYWDQINDFLCKVRIYWFFVSEGFTYWALVVLSTERLMALSFPIKIKNWNIEKIVKIVLIIIFITNLIICSVV